MHYTKDLINNNIMSIEDEKKKICEESQIFSSPSYLTTYKIVVDKLPKYYGLNIYDFNEVSTKLRKQKEFLTKNCIYDKISDNYIPLKDIIISANHNPHRYHAEIQNKIDCLEKKAKEFNLVPIFMTLTLPSEYHKMKTDRVTKELVYNSKYNGMTPKESVKVLTSMLAKLRHDRSLKELSKNQRVFYRVNEPHKDGTPHTHILLFIPKDRIQRVKTAFNRLFDSKANDIQTDIQNAKAYVMKYINKTLPLSKKEKLTTKERYLNAWYSKHRINRFNSSRTLAPINLYRLLYKRFSLIELTNLVDKNILQIHTLVDDTQKIMEVFDGEELLYLRSSNFDIRTRHIDFDTFLKSINRNEGYPPLNRLTEGQ